MRNAYYFLYLIIICSIEKFLENNKVPYTKLREYNGKGTFEFKMEEPIKQEANFKISFFSNAHIQIETSFLLSQVTAKIIEADQKVLFDVSLNGIIIDEIEDIGTISIERMAIDSTTVSSRNGEYWTIQLKLRCFSIVDIIYSDEKSGKVKIHYGLTNFIFSGCIYSIEGKNSLLDNFNANVNNLNFQFKKISDYKIVEKRLKDKKGCHITSEAIVDISMNEIDNAKSTIFDIIELLSLATRNFVSPIYEDYFYNGEIIRTILNPVLTKEYNGADNLIDSNRPNPCILQFYLESTYSKYQELKDVLGLKGVIHIYLISRFAVFTESKFLLSAASLESLLSYFEEYLENKGEPIKSSSVGRTKKTLAKELEKEGIKIENEILERVASSIAYSHPSFSDKLSPLLKMYGVKSDSKDYDLINLRNKVVHYGKFPEEFNSRQIIPHEEETRLVYFLDRILLSILGYRNKPFLNKLNQYQEEELS